jgi:hypothetical protein
MQTHSGRIKIGQQQKTVILLLFRVIIIPNGERERDREKKKNSVNSGHFVPSEIARSKNCFLANTSFTFRIQKMRNRGKKDFVARQDIANNQI